MRLAFAQSLVAVCLLLSPLASFAYLGGFLCVVGTGLMPLCVGSTTGLFLLLWPTPDIVEDDTPKTLKEP